MGKKQKITVNTKALKKWCDQHGRSGELQILDRIKMDWTTLKKILRDDYPHQLKEHVRYELQKITKIPAEELFHRR